MIDYRTAVRPLLTAALLGLMFGCAPIPVLKVEKPVISAEEAAMQARAEVLMAQGGFADAAALYEQLAANTKPPRLDWLLQAADAYIADRNPLAAATVLARVNQGKLQGANRFHARLIGAEILLAQDNAPQALQAIAGPLPLNTPQTLQSRAYRLRASACQLEGRPLQRADALAALDTLLNTRELRLDNQRALLDTLLGMTQASLELLRPTVDGTLGGWMDLARATLSQASRADTSMAALELWRATHPAHPAMPELLEYYRGALGPDRMRFGKVAVLLPASGRYATAANTIREGLLAAYYASTANQLPQLNFYDTSDPASIWPQLQQAAADGAEVAIGPLQKEAVQQLANAGELPIPVLTLNQVNLDTAPPPQLYQFGLAPEDEARQAAERAWADGAISALALVPDSPWGQRMLESFRDRWEQLGGQLVEHARYDNTKNDFSDTIRALLNLDESKARQQALVRLLGQQLEFQPRRRDDAGALFLAANATKARQIWPQLQFHRARTLPVYTSSHIYSGQFNANRDLDLVGLVFPDIPWLLRTQTDQPMQIQQLPPELSKLQGALARLFAMGMDSYALLAGLERLERFPGASLSGATGRLRLDDLKRTRRELPWARINKDGIELLEPSPTPEPEAPMAQAPADITQAGGQAIKTSRGSPDARRPQ